MIVVIIVAAAICTPVSAQQQAVDTLSSTRNPQSTGENLFNQQNDVQTSTDQSTLNTSGSISIPNAVPATAEPGQNAESNNGSLWLIVGAVLGVLGLMLTYFVAKQYRRPAGAFVQQPPVLGAEQQPAEKTMRVPEPSKKPSEKKKKRRAQTKKKKR